MKRETFRQQEEEEEEETSRKENRENSSTFRDPLLVQARIIFFLVDSSNFPRCRFRVSFFSQSSEPILVPIER